MIKEEVVTEEQFEEATQDRVIVDWFANWCGPCRQLAPVLKEMDVPVVKVNVDNNPEIAQEYGIMSLPTLALFEGGKEYDRIIGTTNKQQIQELYEA